VLSVSSTSRIAQLLTLGEASPGFLSEACGMHAGNKKYTQNLVGKISLRRCIAVMFVIKDYAIKAYRGVDA
jgi:hypothetical protein